MRLGPNEIVERSDSLIRLKLSRGKTVVLDIADYPKVKPYRWHAHWDGFNWYADAVIRNLGKRVMLRMHQIIAGKGADHINRNTLDNRRDNLRPATASQSASNRKERSDNLLRLKGVYEYRPNKYRSRIQDIHTGKQLNLGCYDSPVEAALAYDRAAVNMFGPYACTNASLGLLPRVAQGGT